MTNKRQNKQSIDWAGLLAQHPLFDAIDARERDFLLSDKVSKKHVLEAGEVILKQGETGNSLFIVCEGKVSVSLMGPDGEPVELYTLTRGEVFGEMALFEQRLRATTLVTTEPCKLLEIAGNEFLLLMEKHHEIAIYLLATLSQRLRHTDDMILTRRISGLDSSLEELKTRLEIGVEKTEAQLVAAKVIFENTKSNVEQILESAGRARTRATWIASLAGIVLSLLAAIGLWNLDSAKQEVKDIRVEMSLIAERTRGLADRTSERAAVADAAARNAAQSAKTAGTSATTAEEFAKRAKVAETTLAETTRKALANASQISNLSNEVDETNRLIKKAYYEGILTQIMAEFELPGFSDDTPKPKTVEHYFICINADLPEFRAKLVNFMHDQINGRDKQESILGMLGGSLTEYQSRMSADAKVATYYFMALINILKNDSQQAETYEKLIETTTRGGRAYFADIFGTDKFDVKMLINILTHQEDERAILKQRKQEDLNRLYAALKQSN